MFERFTDRARRVVVLAQEEARLLNHHYIGTEHILLGLIQEGEGVAARALESLDISLQAARQRIRELIGEGQAAPTGHIPFTPRAKKVLELSFREALQLGHNYIGTEHLLLGLIGEGEGVAAETLRDLGVDLKRARDAVLRQLRQLERSRASADVEAIDAEMRLRPMREDEWDAWRTRSIQLYSEDMVRNEAMDEARAQHAAAREFDELLVDGLGTAGHHVLVAEDAGSGELVGHVWFGPRPRQPDPEVAWLYDIAVEPELRLVEDEVRAEGVSRIELNVFGDNSPARRLYESAGYTEIARQMAKNLDDPV
jgi:RimJ/RimL family protein N-acetyltransferase